MRALRSAMLHTTLATLTSKGRVTILKRIRDALHLQPGAAFAFSVNADGDVVLHQRRLASKGSRCKDRFDSVRGLADVHWSTDGLMSLLRSED
jgi:antitoxin PrlF